MGKKKKRKKKGQKKDTSTIIYYTPPSTVAMETALTADYPDDLQALKMCSVLNLRTLYMKLLYCTKNELLGNCPLIPA